MESYLHKDIQIHLKPNKFEEAKKNRHEFFQKKSSSPKKTFKGNGRRSIEISPEVGYLRATTPKIDLDEPSYDTYRIEREDSVSLQNPGVVSTAEQEDEKLECLLERLEESRMPEKEAKDTL